MSQDSTQPLTQSSASVQQQFVLASEVQQFVDFIEPDYKWLAVGHRKPDEVRADWNDFWNNQLGKDFTVAVGEKVKNGYMFNAHMGNAARALDTAKDEYVKAMLAYHCERNVKKH